MSVVLFVEHLEIHVTEDDVRALFEQAGQVERVFLMRNDYAIASGLSDKSAFVEMSDDSSASQAINLLNDQPLLGMARLVVRVAASGDGYDWAVAAHEEARARRLPVPEPVQRRRRTGALLLAAVAIWAGGWWWPIPGLALLAWVVSRSHPLVRRKLRTLLASLPWNLAPRRWPPAYATLWIMLPVALLLMLLATRAAREKVLPVGLVLLALTILVSGHWWRPVFRRIDSVWPRRRIPENTIIINAADGSIQTKDAPGPEPLSELIPRLFRRLWRRDRVNGRGDR